MGRHGKTKPKTGFRKFLRILKYTFFWSFILGICIGVFFLSYLFGLEEWKEFKPENIGEMQQTLLIFDKDGNETAALYNKQNRQYVDIEKIPEDVKNAFIAVEDTRFYQHNGVDLIRIVGAFVESITKGNSIRGTSSISQQLVKNTCLTGVRSISRKLQEVVMAFKLEKVYDKDEILEMYLNYIYFGNGAYGIEAASKVYFNKSCSQLTLSEAALLAGVVKGPTHYAPHLNMENSLKRRDLVLSLMHEEEFISAKRYNEALEQEIILIDNTEFEYGFFSDMVLTEAKQILNVDTETLLSGGYKIYTTLDQNVQISLEELFEDESNFPENAQDGTKCQTAVCVLDSETSEIIAIMGAREYETRLCLNRAVSMKRQPGSAIKPVLVYAPAIERHGYTTTTLVLDERGDFNGFVPKNFSNRYSGWVPLRKAVAGSLNLPAVRVLQDIGIESAKHYASGVGIPFAEEDLGLTLALGGFTEGVSPLDLCNSFTPFANGGFYSATSCIKRIEDGRGNIIFEKPDTRISVLSDETAYLMTSMLMSAAEEGTARRVKPEGIEIAAKTGTSGSSKLNGNKDAWTVAYNSELTVCCWMGFDITDDEHCLSSKTTGGTFPAELINKLFTEVYKTRGAPIFTQPTGIVEVKLDIKSLEDKPLLAGTLTPEEETVLEVFCEDNAPTQYSEYWAVPKTPDGISVSQGFGGLPVIKFYTKQKHVQYMIFRVQNGIENLICICNGDKSYISYTDESAMYGQTYQYYVLPVHPELTINEERLAGAPTNSVTITLLPEEHYRP